MTAHLKIQFVVADGARARWVVRSETADDFRTASELHAKPHSAGQPQGAVFDSSSGRPSAVVPRADAVRHHDEAFARELADALNTQAAAGAFERLVLVAPSHTLNAITEHLNTGAKAKLGKTLAKDLSKTPDHELGAWLRTLELG
jgi:protein required for attachment to host cells